MAKKPTSKKAKAARRPAAETKKLKKETSPPEPPEAPARAQVSELLLRAATQIGPRAGARAIILYGDVFPDCEAAGGFLKQVGDLRVVLAARDTESCQLFEQLGGVTVQVPDVRLTRFGQIKVAILLAAARRLIEPGDRVLCLSGLAQSGQVDSVFIIEVGQEFELFATAGVENIPRQVRSEVFERVLDLAISLGNEGREGRPVGTTFVLGDTENVLRHADQLIINPFRGYPEDERNILDPRLQETIKEFSALDGAFIVRDDGAVEAAGSFLRSTIAGEPLPRGLGARHKSAAAVTAATNAVAVTVSESTGNVTVFERGRILSEIEKPRPIGPDPRATAQFYRPDATPTEEEADEV